MIGIIIQARMGSSRLPGKIMKRIGNKTLLEHIFYRLSFLKNNVKVVLATSISLKDDVVEEFCLKNNINLYRGSEENVLERYYLCSKKYGFSQIVRLTGDNPFVDIEELDNLIDLHINTQSDFSNSFKALPIGVGAEIFNFNALEQSYINGKELHHIEHVDEYMIENPQLFKTTTLSVHSSKNFPHIRLTVDTLEDYKKACFIVEQSKEEFIDTEEAVKLCLEYV
ncbi:cytidylyltransferase domain-containing protein [Clostridium saccharoperbutylacetonicum]|uniref:cytidylyltransferase domain-containing protein n=1 Tax=Clostridium saccharoperbutylacetonicum TaxID=36745 RepID=UPI000983C6F0|nr:glycosyltransferase family protein [Clostridium saccharoperbutylacetonicum]AQR96983.1 3-deoxy-manno-octulosonate cytidylyltransferase [Clostridium saccharoperbutylacetonicum]NSB32862.1 spore coat polysaccharide biosynthesis protein SpsF [Clostridium saccharoperbutylacetonicum]